MARMLVWSGTRFKTLGVRKKLEHIEFAEICEVDQFEEVFQRASAVDPIVGVVQLEDPMKLAQIAAYGVAGLFNEPK